MESRPVVHAMIAAFLALGEAVGEHTLQRAGNLIRDLIADNAMNPETVDILETVLVGIDTEPQAPTPHLERYRAEISDQGHRWAA